MAVQIIIRNPLDRDAREYMARAGVTDAAARTQINEFCRGIKSLGLWDSMVCWPLRSAQNASTSTTAYSLGGLGTYNGTLVGGPTWNADGIYLDSTDDYADMTIVPATNGNCSLYLAHKPTVDENCNLLGCRTSASLTTNGGGFEASRRGTTTGNRKGEFLARYASGLVASTISGAETLNANHAYAYLYDATNKKTGVMVDSFSSWTLSSAAPSNFGATDRSLKIGTEGSTSAADSSTGYYAFLAMWQGLALTEAQVTSFHALYKATLGTGLGLT